VILFPTKAQTSNLHHFDIDEATDYQKNMLGMDKKLTLTDPNDSEAKVLKLSLKAMPEVVEWPTAYYT
jgi:hypothetical protein